VLNWRGLPYYGMKSIFGSHSWKTHLREVRNSNIKQLADRYLRNLLQHAAANVPHYRSLCRQGDHLDKYPILRKEEIRLRPSSFQRDDRAGRDWLTIKSSGSTGEPIEVLADWHAMGWFETADVWYLAQMLSTPHWQVVSSRKARLWSQDTPPGWSAGVVRLARLLAPIIWLDPYAALSEDVLLAYAHTINKFKPTFIWAYAGVLYELAKIALARRLRLCQPSLIISSAETLHAFMRSIIEEAFGCRVYNIYGLAEAGCVAGECTAGNLHVLQFAVRLEVLDHEGRPVRSGDVGRVVVTPLHNYAMPLIRYDTGDTAEAGPPVCPCGSALPVLKRISGRTVEFFVRHDGSLISGGALQSRLKDCSWILSSQILQEDVDRITLRYVPVRGTPVCERDMAAATVRIADVMGPGCRIDWEEVEEIPRTRNGKRPYARSLVWETRQPVDFWSA